MRSITVDDEYVLCNQNEECIPNLFFSWRVWRVVTTLCCISKLQRSWPNEINSWKLSAKGFYRTIIKMAQERNTGIFQGLQGDCSYFIDLIKHDITVGLLNITMLNLIPAISLSVTIGQSFAMHFAIPWSLRYVCILVCFSLFVMEGYAHLTYACIFFYF